MTQEEDDKAEWTKLRKDLNNKINAMAILSTIIKIKENKISKMNKKHGMSLRIN